MQSDFYKIAAKVDSLLAQYSEDHLNEIASCFKYEGIKEYFFTQLAKTANLAWFIPLKERGYFKPSDNPKPQESPTKPGLFMIPYWSVLDYLQCAAKKNAENALEEITNTLLDICDAIISYKDESDHRIDNFKTDHSVLIVLSNLPTQIIQDMHIEFIRDALKSKWSTTLIESDLGGIFLSKLIKDGAKDRVLHLLDVILDYKKVDNKYADKYMSIMDQYWLAEALRKNKPDIAKLCGLQAADVAISKMKSILEEDNSRFNSIWIPTIEDHSQIAFPDRYECQLVQFVRDMFEYSASGAVKEKIRMYRVNNHPILRRIAYHVIKIHYDVLKELFWEAGTNPLLDVLATHEIYELINDNCSKFEENQVRLILSWIETNDYEMPAALKADNQKAEKYIARQKKEWLTALIKTKAKEVIDAYEKYNMIYSYEIDHPGFTSPSWSESGTVSVVSPIQEEQLCKMSIEEIVEYVNNFKGESEVDWRSYKQVSISDTFGRCVSMNAKKISSYLSPFLELKRRYQNILLRSFADAWKNEAEFDWKAVLGFINDLITTSEFWAETYEEKSENYRNSIVQTVADLINEGTKSDAHAFDPALLPLAEGILLHLLSKTESSARNSDDIVTAVLNSPKGRVLTALVNYSLRYARLYRKKEECRWVETVEKEFTRRLDRTIEPSIDFTTILGEYIPNLFYLNKKWVTENVNKILPIDSEEYWEAAFTGYLYLANRVYREVYLLLKENGHYSKAITYKFKDSFAVERLSQHIIIGYIKGWDTLSEEQSELKQLLKNNKPDQLSQLVNFVWMFRDTKECKIQERIKPLWHEVYKIIKDQVDNPQYQEIASKLGDWLTLVDKIDEDIVEWVSLSTKYIEHPVFFMDYLLQHSESAPKEVGTIYLEMLTSGNYPPTYKQERIVALVQSLYDKKQKDIANKISNIYGAKGILFLRDVYEKNNQ